MLNLQDRTIDRSQSLNKLLQAPGFNVHYTFKGFWDIRASWRYSQRISDPDNFYYAYILKNYKELIKKEVLIQESNQNIIGISFSYRNSISAFFNTLSYYFVQRQTNLLYSNELQDDGSLVITAIEIPNTTLSHSVKLRSSKYISVLRSSVSSDIFYMTFIGKTLVNNELFDSRNSQYILSPEIYYQTTSWMNFNYKFQYNVIYLKTNEELSNKTKVNKHYLSLNLFPTDNQIFNLNFEYSLYNQISYNFVDLVYRYSFKKSNLEIELRWNNIFNSNMYIDQQTNQFIVAEYAQLLRPSQVILGLRFSF